MNDSRPSTGFTRAVDRFVLVVARHWLALLNLVALGFLGLAFLAPVLMHLGVQGPARLVYSVFSFMCHQLPERSLYLFGPQPFFSATELEAWAMLPQTLDLLERRHFIGDPTIGYKVALCQRDIALYLSFVLSGIAYRQINRWRPVRLPIWTLLIFWAPLAVDGLTQLVGLRESIWQLRFLTGFVASFGTAWVVHPIIDQGMQDVIRTVPAPAPAPAP